MLCGPLLLACGAIEDGPPPRNPLAETAPIATATASPAATSQPAATQAAADVTPPPAALAESATGRAIELLAEWLGAPQTDFSVVATDAVVWPDACLGVSQPIVCAQVVTAGFRVTLRDALGVPHTLHTDAAGDRVRWAGEATASGIVTAVDLGARRFTLMVGGSALELRIAPGTWWSQDDTPASIVGRAVTVGYDPTPNSAEPPSAAWVVLAPP